MRILLVTPYFPPEVGSASHLLYELGGELVRRGHHVHVATLFPRYHVRAADSRYRRRAILTETVAGMRVSRVRIPSLPRAALVARGVDQFLAAAALLAAGVRAGSVDAILQYSPPLPVGLAGLALARWHGSVWVLNVQDLFPQSAVDLGVLHSPAVIRAYQALETFLYRQASHVTVHSAGNAAHVRARDVPDQRVSVVANWVDTRHIRPGERLNAFRAHHGLGDRFVASFAGVLGYSQDLDVVLEAAERVRDEARILFLVVGDGVEKPRLEQKARQLGLSNVRFLPMLPRHEYPALLAASDVGLATLRREVRTPVVPSKIPSIMAAGRPVAAALDLAGDAPRLIAAAGAGYAVPPGDAAALAGVVRRLSAEPALAAALGANGRRYVEKTLSLEAAAAQYESLFGTLIESRAPVAVPAVARVVARQR